MKLMQYEQQQWKHLHNRLPMLLSPELGPPAGGEHRWPIHLQSFMIWAMHVGCNIPCASALVT